jgi:hypothetical protein
MKLTDYQRDVVESWIDQAIVEKEDREVAIARALNALDDQQGRSAKSRP